MNVDHCAWILIAATIGAGCSGDDGDGSGATETAASSTGSPSASASATAATPPTTPPPTTPSDVTAGGSSGGAPTGTTTESADADDSSSGSGGPSSGSIGCRSGRGLPEGETQFELDGNTRRYVLHLPNGYAGDTPYPLLLALHPNGGAGNVDYWNATEGNRAIRPLVEDEAILVLPEDLNESWPDDLPTELAYFDTIIEQMKTELCVDTSRIFSMGFSGGGSFSGVLGCMREDIRAIASGGSIIYFEPEDCVGTPAAWITIGQDELTDGRAAFRDFWRETGGCDANSTPTDPDPCVAYDACADPTPVHYCQHGGGHQWPAFGTEAAWAFLSQF